MKHTLLCGLGGKPQEILKKSSTIRLNFRGISWTRFEVASIFENELEIRTRDMIVLQHSSVRKSVIISNAKVQIFLQSYAVIYHNILFVNE